MPGEALLAINTILQDSSHHSPLVRALVITTVSMIKSESANGLFHKIISGSLKIISRLESILSCGDYYECDLKSQLLSPIYIKLYDIHEVVLSAIKNFTCGLNKFWLRKKLLPSLLNVIKALR